VRIAILGAGGVGGYYGGLLARGGHDVALVARGAHLAALREEGLRVESVHGDFTVRSILATDDSGEIGPVDLVLVAVKSYDLDTAAEAARPLVGPDTVVLPLLNGLDAAQRLAAVLGDGPVLAGLTHISSSLAAAGQIRQISSVQRITLGERDGKVTPRAQRVGEALSSSGIEVVISDQIDVALWDKFLFIASISGVCCLARQPIGIVLGTPETRRLYVQALREIEAIRHCGKDPGSERGISARDTTFHAGRSRGGQTHRTGSSEWCGGAAWPFDGGGHVSAQRGLRSTEAGRRVENPESKSQGTDQKRKRRTRPERLPSGDQAAQAWIVSSSLSMPSRL
jgi:2-dehydropantoate 2-reductase